MTSMINLSPVSFASICNIFKQSCMSRYTLTDLNPNEYNQRLHYYLFTVNLDRSNRICNTLNDLSKKISVPSKTEDANLSIVNMIVRIIKSKTLAKRKCKYDDKKCILNQKWNNGASWCECKNMQKYFV